VSPRSTNIAIYLPKKLKVNKVNLF